MQITQTQKEFGSSCSLSYAIDYFKYVMKKHESAKDDHPIRIYITKVKNRTTF